MENSYSELSQPYIHLDENQWVIAALIAILFLVFWVVEMTFLQQKMFIHGKEENIPVIYLATPFLFVATIALFSFTVSRFMVAIAFPIFMIALILFAFRFFVPTKHVKNRAYHSTKWSKVMNGLFWFTALAPSVYWLYLQKTVDTIADNIAFPIVLAYQFTFPMLLVFYIYKKMNFNVWQTLISFIFIGLFVSGLSIFAFSTASSGFGYIIGFALLVVTLIGLVMELNSVRVHLKQKKQMDFL
ncbi:MULTISPECIES: hypothetical protein [Bacillus amyloliquefaciens group]|uniref:hypothetical protein n=1 Tax=Bacillus amyloliquefaciens group TaxID=1938374 RepID=UPI0021B0AD8A|nr:hypothetical protein [Bacillus velezensis]MCT6684494.1 hypothetical protein [Bacillus velezensis]MCY0092280.1 hypothetical protein [Bacillus velezensis]HEO2443510.1 hypothetical protein [Streptococcus agalactiae]